MVRRTVVAAVVVLATLVSGCGLVGRSRGADIDVRVDYRFDEFATHFWRYFPSAVAARPGDTIVFQQEWTGEPHTVTMGTLVDAALDRVDAIEARFGDEASLSEAELEEAETAYDAALAAIPPLVDEPFGDMTQNGGQPCYLDEGAPPADRDTPCDDADQIQPPFDGRQSFYHSGFIPFEGPSGNTYKVRLSPDIEPGSYRFYCTIHLPWMQGTINVLTDGEEPPDETERHATARAEIDALAGPLRQAYEDALAGRTETGGLEVRPPLAGYHAGDEFTVAVDEFVPEVIEAAVGEPVTWTVVGAHTVSFDVPEYFPVYVASDDGKVRLNPKVRPAAGGSPPPPPIDFESREPLEVDGGTYDGEGFFSSGLLGAEPFARYTLRFAQPGRYKYACLIHPPMVGVVDVTA